MKNLLLFSMLSILFVLGSCTKESIEKENHYADFQFYGETFTAEVTSIAPVEIESEDLQVVEVTNEVTGKKGYMVLHKDANLESGNGDANNRGIENGYFFDGDDCFVYGTYYIDDNTGDGIFVPASAATQYLMNQCGYSNMA